MEIVRDRLSLQEALAGFMCAGETLALVPTMGALHSGHLTLVAEARKHAPRVAVSIFVNPKQFGPNEDFSRYPRDEETDLALLNAVGCDLAYLPTPEEIYPAGYATSIHVDGVSEGLCGAHRPGHFDGVATVVAKLLLQTMPDVALFGEKDYQQLCVIRRLVADLDLPVRIVGVPTLREADGLALSSRNRYLSQGEREVAPRLYETLQAVAAQPALLKDAEESLLHAGFAAVEYLELRDAETLIPVHFPLARPARLLTAVRLGTTRLIDNIPVEPCP